MKLQWLGHSSFRLIESTGSSIILDPFEASSVGYSMAYLNCDAVTASNNMSDHNNYKAVKGNPIIINTMGSYDINGIHVSTVLSNTQDEKLRPLKNLIFKLRLDGVSVCHLGAITDKCSADLTEELIPVNILLVPVGGSDSTLDAEQAKEYVDNILPDIVIPMHYKTKDSEMDIDKVEDFLRLFEDNQIIICEDNTIEFDRYDFNGESTKIIVPKRFKG